MTRIIARLHDGLGNQLFIYAAARAIAEARGDALLLDTYSGFARDRKYGATSQLEYFAVKAPIAPKVLGVETSLDGFAKLGRFSRLKISHRKISFTRSVRGVVLIAARSKSC